MKIQSKSTREEIGLKSFSRYKLKARTVVGKVEGGGRAWLVTLDLSYVYEGRKMKNMCEDNRWDEPKQKNKKKKAVEVCGYRFLFFFFFSFLIGEALPLDYTRYPFWGPMFFQPFHPSDVSVMCIIVFFNHFTAVTSL